MNESNEHIKDFSIIKEEFRKTRLFVGTNINFLREARNLFTAESGCRYLIFI